MPSGDRTKTDAGPDGAPIAQATVPRGDRLAATEAGGEPKAAAELEKYLVHLVHLDMALPLKIELIRALRAIMQSFIDRAFGDDPVQLARRDSLIENKTAAITESNMIESQKSQMQINHVSDEFQLNAGAIPERKEQSCNKTKTQLSTAGPQARSDSPRAKR